jgi:hypothetical protein
MQDLALATEYGRLSGLGTTQRFVRLMILFALKYEADQLILEPEDGACSLRFRVGGGWNDMAPPPAHLLRETAVELRRMAGVVEPSRSAWLARIFRKRERRATRPPDRQTAEFDFRVDVAVGKATVHFSPSANGERIFLEIAASGEVRAAAKFALDAMHQQFIMMAPDIADDDVIAAAAPLTKLLWSDCLSALRAGADQIAYEPRSGRMVTRFHRADVWEDQYERSIEALAAMPLELDALDRTPKMFALSPDSEAEDVVSESRTQPEGGSSSVGTTYFSFRVREIGVAARALVTPSSDGNCIWLELKPDVPIEPL